MQLSVCDSLRKMDPKENKNGHSMEILFLRKKKKKRGSRLFHPIIISIIKYSNIHKKKKKIPVIVKIPPIMEDVVIIKIRRPRKSISKSFGDNLLRK